MTDTQKFSKDLSFKFEKRVLVVDDEEDIALFLKAYLTKMGASVDVATDGREAINMFMKENSNYEFVFSDYSMPLMNGEQLLNEIQKIKKQGVLTFIMMTGGTLGDDVEKRLQKNSFFGGYILKPFNSKSVEMFLINLLAQKSF